VNSIEIFFKTFTSFQLFQRPQFWRKVRLVDDGNQVNALIASMMAFAVSFWDSDCPEQCKQGLFPDRAHAASWIDLAMKFTDQALLQCGDDPPPIMLLQALILISYWLLIKGVRGRAWRCLGTCVRIAYEMNLHLIDAGETPSSAIDEAAKWCDAEEKRRAWWAIWEMDVFASAIRRCPTAIDWRAIRTLLPAEDGRWYQNEPQVSCFLESGLTARCKALQASGNQAAKAWFIVINSIMKEAQAISSPISIDQAPSASQVPRSHVNHAETEERRAHMANNKEATTRLMTLYNAARYFGMALPTSLKYCNQHLNFSSSDVVVSCEDTASIRDLHSSIYSIHLMRQLTILMIHKFHIFRTESYDKTPPMRASNGISYIEAPSSFTNLTTVVEQYFEASDSILAIIHTSSENHHRYVNPFLASTIWLACAAQLVRRELVSMSESEKDLIDSNFEVLSITYEQFAQFWTTPSTLKQNLQALENLLLRAQQTVKEKSSDCRGAEDRRQMQERPLRRANGDAEDRRQAGSVCNQKNNLENRFEGIPNGHEPVNSTLQTSKGTHEDSWTRSQLGVSGLQRGDKRGGLLFNSGRDAEARSLSRGTTSCPPPQIVRHPSCNIQGPELRPLPAGEGSGQPFAAVAGNSFPAASLNHDAFEFTPTSDMYGMSTNAHALHNGSDMYGLHNFDIFRELDGIEAAAFSEHLDQFL